MEESAGSSGGRKGLNEDAKLWSRSLRDVLSSKDGRKEFIRYLDYCEFYVESLTVKFWEKCKDIEAKCEQLKGKKSSATSYDSDALKELISEASTVVAEYVNSGQINLDKGLIDKLNICLESEDPDLMAKVFKEARSTAHDLLKCRHSGFAEVLDSKEK